MKIFSMLFISLVGQSAGWVAAQGTNRQGRSAQGSNLARFARNMPKQEHDDTALIRLMQDESTFYELMLSGALTRDEVNAILKNRDSHFVELDQRQYNMLLNQWLFQMIYNA